VRKRPLLVALTGLPLLLSSLATAPAASAAAPVQVILDGRTLALSPAPTIMDDRTLVPLRGVFESMGAQLEWQQETQTVVVTRGDRYLRLRIGHRLTCLNRECTAGATLDVPAQLIDDRTFVPVRFIAQAMGVGVTWDNDRRAVVIDTKTAPDYAFTQVTIPSVFGGETITGPTKLQAAGLAGSQVQFYLIDPATGAGRMVAAGPDPKAEYSFTPEPGVTGMHLMVAAVLDSAGIMRYSDPVPLMLLPDPQVSVTGLDAGGTVDGPISFSSAVNFVATQVKFVLRSTNGTTEDLGTVGPGDKLTWYPQVAHNGDKSIQAIAKDINDKEYASAPLPVKVVSDYRTSVSGIQDSDVLDRPISLRVSANYKVESVKYTLDDKVLGWGYAYDWKFGPELNGPHTLKVETLDAAGIWRTAGTYHITVKTTPQVWLSGVGPDQVVTDPVTLKVASNVAVTSVEYYLTDDATGRSELLGKKIPAEVLSWSPNSGQAGSRTLQTKAFTAAGAVIWSEKVSFRVFLGKVYGPTPVVTKDQFKDLAVGLSVPIYREVGMSAALQTAQAILETGWGQSMPVDKYSGQPSFNLFGIKGTGPAGSIISNTWEVYNGVTYRIDANFRAYHNVNETWRDHGDLLLTRPWYAPFRAVMSDPILGAWALRRSGYATDPNYPVKLIQIMKANDLFKTDYFEL
jgi:hypothetical protein